MSVLHTMTIHRLPHVRSALLLNPQSMTNGDRKTVVPSKISPEQSAKAPSFVVSTACVVPWPPNQVGHVIPCSPPSVSRNHRCRVRTSNPRQRSPNTTGPRPGSWEPRRRHHVTDSLPATAWFTIELVSLVAVQAMNRPFKGTTGRLAAGVKSWIDVRFIAKCCRFTT